MTTEIREAIAAADARIAHLRAANEAARARLSPEGRRDANRAWMRRLAVCLFLAGFAVGHVTENDHRHEHARVESILHGERMYSKHYELDYCTEGRKDTSAQMLRCRSELEQ